VVDAAFQLAPYCSKTGRQDTDSLPSHEAIEDLNAATFPPEQRCCWQAALLKQEFGYESGA